MEKELDESQSKYAKLKEEYVWLETKLNEFEEHNDMQEDKIDQEKDKFKDVNKEHIQNIKQLQMKLREKDETILGLEKALENERQATDSIEHEKLRLQIEVKTLTEIKKDIKEKMHYYKKSCSKLDNDLKAAYENTGELKARILLLEKEQKRQYDIFYNIYSFSSSTMKLGGSMHSNLMPTRDTKDPFDYKNHTVYDDPVMEDDEIHGKIKIIDRFIDLEFSDFMSIQNKTCQIESLADELEFYDQADDNDNDHGVYESVDQIQYIESKREHKKSEENKSDRGIQVQEEPNFHNTGSSTEIANYMLCQNCMKEKGILFDPNSSQRKLSAEVEQDQEASSLTETETKNLKYYRNRDPMKEFFVLTAQSVKLNSPYMDIILNLHINQMYEKVVKSSTPFYKWSQWIEDYLHRTILSKIYTEAFLNQSSKKSTSKPVSAAKVAEGIPKATLSHPTPSDLPPKKESKGRKVFGFLKFMKKRNKSSKNRSKPRKQSA